MKLTFLGTRGNIEAKTRRHRRHTCLRAEYRGADVLIDCGRDWLGRLESLAPDAVVLTHAHPDHAFGLEQGAPCPVYATVDAAKALRRYPLDDLRTVAPRLPIRIGGIELEAFSVEHSIQAPAVGYRIAAGRATVFYAPDLVYIHEREEALRGCSLYIGDGATMRRSFVRKRGDRLIGHAPVQTQLTWCEKEGVPRAVITHCGSQIIAGDERRLGAELRRMARERGVEARFAYDGLEMILRG